MAFLVIDNRFGTAIHVFLSVNPSGVADFPGLPVREVDLEPLVAGSPCGMSGGVIGQHTGHRDEFREFETEQDVALARFHLVEPRYVGSTWTTYVCNYLPAGSRKKPSLRVAARPS